MQPTIHLKNPGSEQEKGLLQAILGTYHIGSETTGTMICTKLAGGLCNTTYKIETDSGRYILQQVAPAMPAHITKDIAVITDHLSKKGRQIPLLKKNKDGERESFHDDGSKRRMCTYIDHYTTISSNEMLKNSYHAGKLLAQFHTDIVDLAHTFISPGFDNFHNTPFYIQKLQTYVEQMENTYPELTDDVNYILTKADQLTHESLFGEQIIHADPKFANILFDHSSLPFTFIDFDTLMIGSPLIDVGDMLRSCLHDDGDAVITYDKKQIDEIIQGYYDYTHYQERFPYKKFQDHALHSLMVLLIEQGTRNFIDIVENYYYSPSSSKFSSRRERNTAMATNHIALAKRVEQLINE